MAAGQNVASSDVSNFSGLPVSYNIQQSILPYIILNNLQNNNVEKSVVENTPNTDVSDVVKKPAAEKVKKVNCINDLIKDLSSADFKGVDVITSLNYNNKINMKYDAASIRTDLKDVKKDDILAVHFFIYDSGDCPEHFNSVFDKFLEKYWHERANYKIGTYEPEIRSSYVNAISSVLDSNMPPKVLQKETIEEYRQKYCIYFMIAKPNDNSIAPRMYLFKQNPKTKLDELTDKAA